MIGKKRKVKQFECRPGKLFLKMVNFSLENKIVNEKCKNTRKWYSVVCLREKIKRIK